MKIILPKTLAEPLTIPWDRITYDDKELANFIKEKLHKYLDMINAWKAQQYGDHHPRFSQSTILGCLRVVARKRGGIDVDSELRGEIVDSDNGGKHIGYVYQVFFRTRKNGPMHSTLIA